MKRGRISKHEKKYIEDNAPYSDYLTIAKELDRDPNAIKEIMESELGIITNLAKGNIQRSSNLHLKSWWKFVKTQFSADELILFDDLWRQIVEQFKDDVMPTEESQIVDVIKLEILMNRILTDQEKTRVDIEGLEKALMAEKKKDRDDRDMMLINNLSQQISVSRQAQTITSKEYRDLQEKKNAILKTLKATRDQRYAKVESSRESFSAWMRELIENREKRLDMGRYIEKFRLANIDEYVRLAAYHKYEDGRIDQPLLNHETVKEDNKREELQYAG